jgi:hypothetical protein
LVGWVLKYRLKIYGKSAKMIDIIPVLLYKSNKDVERT